MNPLARTIFCLFLPLTLAFSPLFAQKTKPAASASSGDSSGESLVEYRIDGKSPIPPSGPSTDTTLPLEINPGDHIAFIGNTLFDRAQDFGLFETMLAQRFPTHKLVVRTLAWSADEIDLQPRPANFGSMHQHLAVIEADIIFAGFGYNESFAGEAGAERFGDRLRVFLQSLKSTTYNGKTGPRIVLVSPTANEDVTQIDAGTRNNPQLAIYTRIMAEVAKELKVGFVDVFKPTATLVRAADKTDSLTFNGVHLTETGYRHLADALFRGTFDETPPQLNAAVRAEVLEKNEQFHYRYRPVNSFYYVGGRNRKYGAIDFLPAMRRFDTMISNRDARIWKAAQGQALPTEIDDSNAPPLPKGQMERSANKWKTPADELADFTIDPRFEVNCFASEEDFPDLACPVAMRWDSRGRLWVSCSTTYPHIYPGNAPKDKMIILEDTDQDGKADTSTVWADDLHIPLSFVFGNGGVYLSEQPSLTFLKDTNGDGKADYRRKLLTGFGTEDSHHSLHDFTWTPDGDLIFRESVFHHSQVETPRGPVRLADSGWFRYTPHNEKLISFGMYFSTNPWGVTYDHWGQHMASHPIFASAFHALNPPYPESHPKPAGLKAYSGTAGAEFVDMAHFPDELRGHFIKARYKPTNNIEIHKWVKHDDHYEEEKVSDLIFSKNLSFIPVDLRFGPRGAMYICDWYNPVKGHAQYSLRDERRDRSSGRIWRITAKDRPLMDPPTFAEASTTELVEVLARPEIRYRYWAKQELRDRERSEVITALDTWLSDLDQAEPDYRHHQLEALWTYRTMGETRPTLLKELMGCENPHARAAATRQFRYSAAEFENPDSLLMASATDTNGLVRLEAVIAASYIGGPAALRAVKAVMETPRSAHLNYAIACALGSHTLQPLWKQRGDEAVDTFMARYKKARRMMEEKSTSSTSAFDNQPNVAVHTVSCVPERIRFTKERFTVNAGQPVKLVFQNPDVTQHNLVICKPGTAEAVGLLANDMAKDPSGAKKSFIPETPDILHATKLLEQDRLEVLRFKAPTTPGTYPYICTFPGHWFLMKGTMIVK